MFFSARTTAPAKDLYVFKGKLDANIEDSAPKVSYDLDMNQFLHSGAILENSEKVLAMVIHTGTDTKLI